MRTAPVWSFTIPRMPPVEICAKLEEIWSEHKGTVTRLPALLENTRVRARNLSRPLEEYAAPATFGQTNDHWIATALELGEQSIGAALAQLGLSPRDIDAIFAVSVTGLCSPSLDAHLLLFVEQAPDDRFE